MRLNRSFQGVLSLGQPPYSRDSTCIAVRQGSACSSLLHSDCMVQAGNNQQQCANMAHRFERALGLHSPLPRWRLQAQMPNSQSTHTMTKLLLRCSYL